MSRAQFVKNIRALEALCESQDNALVGDVRTVDVGIPVTQVHIDADWQRVGATKRPVGVVAATIEGVVADGYVSCESVGEGIPRRAFNIDALIVWIPVDGAAYFNSA
ncbi:MAG TPA: hypothetical protein DHU81_11645, partial [Hyphomonas sp.]|nr:hypothetical protein [Hyphomonas sp.]